MIERERDREKEIDQRERESGDSKHGSLELQRSMYVYVIFTILLSIANTFIHILMY